MHLGERDAPCVRVVGVAEDSHQMWIREDSRMGFYIPLEQYRGAFLVRALFARARTSAATTIPLVRAAVQSVDPNLPFVTVQVLQDLIDPQTKSWRLGAAMFSGFGGLALVMASIGVYGLMMYVVRRRTREIGIRIAIGASNSRIIRAVIGETMAFTLLGAAIGAGAAVAIGRGMAGLLFGVSPSDPAVYAVALTVIGVVAAGASYVPAREATRVDPMLALKAE
jgi:ABC-type antimicrobial peptide transport system permease subunit